MKRVLSRCVVLTACLAWSVSVSAAAARGELQTEVSRLTAAAEHLVHQWTFNDGTANDSVGTAHGQLSGTTYIGNGALYLTGESSANKMQTAALGASLNDRTLVAWCSLEDLGGKNERKCAGAVITVVDVAANPRKFDGIVMGERTELQWMSGSDFWVRSPENNGGSLETAESPEMVMMAITYSANPYRVTIYRNGALYATHTYTSDRYTPTLPTLSANSVAMIGPRDVDSGFIKGYVDEARVYDACLTAEEISAIYAEGPVPCPISTPWNGSFEIGSPYTGFPDDPEAKTRLDNLWCTLAGWYDESNGYTGNSFIEVVNQWWCNNPTDGYTQMWLEIAGGNNGADSEHCPAIQSGPLGNIVAGESYRVQADFSSGPNAGKWTINYANIELLDVTAGDTIAQWSQVIPTAYTTVSCDFTTPVMDASRHGHSVRIRFAVPTFLDEYYGAFQTQFAVDNVRVSVISNAVPTPGSVTYTQVADGVVSEGANWQNGVAPTGAVATLTFPSRQTAATTVSSVEVDTALWVSNLVVAGEHNLATRVIDETDGGRFSLYAGGGVAPTANIGTGLTRIRQLSAPDGFVKTGAGMLQVGGFRALGGTIDIREGRVTVGDELAHRWSFNDGTARDLCGPADGTVSGSACISNGELVVAGPNGQFVTGDLGQSLSNKTLMVWTRLRDPTVSTKGSALTVSDVKRDGCCFDGIVYGEKTAQYWMSGSENWHRTADVAGQDDSFAETATDEIQIAISYQSINGSVWIARNGAHYGDYSSFTLGWGIFVSPPTSHALIGPRHWNNKDIYDGTINEARIYRYNLSIKSFAAITAAGPNAGAEHLGRAAKIPAGAKVRLGGAGTIFDLNMNAQTIDELSGAGEVWNGTLTVAKALTVTGRLVVDGNLVLGESCRIRFTDANAALVVKGAITLPEYAKIEFAFNEATTGEKAFISTTAETDWSPLDCWNIAEPKARGFKFAEKRTTTSFGYTCESNGLLIILK